MALTGRTVLVTGASRGIGRAIALACAEAGARVLIHYAAHGQAALDLAAEIGAPDADCLRADLSQPGAGAALWAAARLRGGVVPDLVNNAGIFEAADALGPDTDWERVWERTMAVNLRAVADLCRAALRDYCAQEGGRMVTIASRAAHRGDDPDCLAYAASKGAVVSLMKSIARGYGDRGVLAYTIAPGWVATDMAPTDPAARTAMTAQIPLGHVAAPQEIGALTAFLLSGACPSATGATLDVNGASYVR